MDYLREYYETHIWAEGMPLFDDLPVEEALEINGMMGYKFFLVSKMIEEARSRILNSLCKN